MSDLEFNKDFQKLTTFSNMYFFNIWHFIKTSNL